MTPFKFTQYHHLYIWFEFYTSLNSVTHKYKGAIVIQEETLVLVFVRGAK